MLNFLVRRLMIGVVTLLLITFLVYALIRHMPGTPLTLDAAQMDPSKMPSVEELDRLKKQYGLDKPWYKAYFIWLGKTIQLDLGDSIPQKEKVASLIAKRVPATMLLTVTSLILTYLLCIPMGLWSTMQSGTVGERSVSTFLYMLYSLPSFVAALFMQIVICVKFEWLPLYGMQSKDYDTFTTLGKAGDIMLHSILPIACFTYGSLAYYSRFVKANMEEVVRQDYIRTAKAKGVSSHNIIFHHAFRNTLIPLVTLLGLSLPGLLSGAVILERVFVWPGMGSLYFESIGRRDYDTIMGLTLMFSVLTLLGQLVADVLYAIVDPRVTYS
jgi:peptide/nickel transport system permease protein